MSPSTRYFLIIFIIWLLPCLCLSLDTRKLSKDDLEDVQLTRHYQNGSSAIIYLSQIVENDTSEIFPPSCCSKSKHLNITVQRVVNVTNNGKKQEVHQNLPVFFFSRRDCSSTGNMIGMFYESYTFAMYHQMAIALIANAHCKFQPTLLSHLPAILYPPPPSVVNVLSSSTAQKNYNTWMDSHFHHNTKFCHGLPKYPWERNRRRHSSAAPLSLFDNIDQISQLNHQMVSNYIASYHQQQSNVTQEDVVQSMKDTIAIHFRCRDNFVTAMGILPFRIYLARIKEIITHFYTNHNQYEFASITIISDAMPGGGYPGDTCWRLIGELRRLLFTFLAATNNTSSDGHHHDYYPLMIKDVYTTPYLSYVMLHYAKVVICSISTFCFFAALEAEEEREEGKEAVVGRNVAIMKNKNKKNKEITREVHFVNESSVAVVQVPAYFFDDSSSSSSSSSFSSCSSSSTKRWKGIPGVKGIIFNGSRKSDAREWEKMFQTIVYS